jgi:hypothetical protein
MSHYGELTCSRTWLGLHACLDGNLEIRLPQEAAEVIEQRTGQIIARDVRRFTVSTHRGETLLWRIQDKTEEQGE